MLLPEDRPGVRLLFDRGLVAQGRESSSRERIPYTGSLNGRNANGEITEFDVPIPLAELSLALSSPTGSGTQQAGPLIQLKALLEGTRRPCETLELKRSRHALERDRLEHSSAFCAALSATLTSCSTATELRAVTAIVMALSHA